MLNHKRIQNIARYKISITGNESITPMLVLVRIFPRRGIAPVPSGHVKIIPEKKKYEQKFLNAQLADPRLIKKISRNSTLFPGPFCPHHFKEILRQNQRNLNGALWKHWTTDNIDNSTNKQFDYSISTTTSTYKFASKH